MQGDMIVILVQTDGSYRPSSVSSEVSLPRIHPLSPLTHENSLCQKHPWEEVYRSVTRFVGNKFLLFLWNLNFTRQFPELKG